MTEQLSMQACNNIKGQIIQLHERFLFLLGLHLKNKQNLSFIVLIYSIEKKKVDARYVINDYIITESQEVLMYLMY